MQGKHFTLCRPEQLNGVVKPSESPPPMQRTSPAHQHPSLLPSWASPVGTSKLEQLMEKSHWGGQILLSEQQFPFPNQAFLLFLVQPDQGAKEK